ncbi:hypothetical protein GF369_00490 [Candidatus Peregrinibacteria bacterium]|nr:hypothetical protein [Candidatus Peregrinibacteria bacterium]
MKKQKYQHSTSTKYNTARDFVMFLSISAITLTILYFVVPKKPDITMVVIFIILVVPTIIALISGAPFVPTPMHVGKKMLQLGKVKKGETVVDIGCGDGRLVYLAAHKYGARAIGYELSPIVYILAKIRQCLWRSKATITFGDFRMHDLSQVDCIVTYMLPDTLKKFVPKFEKELKPGARIVSYAFHIGDWKPTHVEPACAREHRSKIWVYEIGKQT